MGQLNCETAKPSPLTEAAAFLGKYVIITQDSVKFPVGAGVVTQVSQDERGNVRLEVSWPKGGSRTNPETYIYGERYNFTEYESINS